MFREMRRSRQQLSPEAAQDILRRGSHGVLAVSGDGGYPYAVPLSYVYASGRLYIHCAKSGHKLDAVRRCGKASFCVVERDDVVPEEFTTRYVSAIAFGKVRELSEEAEMRSAIELLCRKYCPGVPAGDMQAEMEREWASLHMLAFEIEHLTGKQSRELIGHS